MAIVIGPATSLILIKSIQFSIQQRDSIIAKKQLNSPIKLFGAVVMVHWLA